MSCQAFAAVASTAAMTGTDDTPTREERLAAKLRENLRRRKAQSRAMGAGAPATPGLPKETGER